MAFVTSLPGIARMGHFHTGAPVFNSSLRTNFQNHLSNIRTDGQEECISHCIENAKEVVQLFEFSEWGINRTDHVMKCFREIVSESFVNEGKVNSLNKEFTHSFCEMMRRKWSKDSAESFYIIPEISHEQEQVLAAQKWTQAYFVALNKLSDWQLHPLTRDFVKRFSRMTLNHFNHHAINLSEQKIKLMLFQIENDPISFNRIMRSAVKKAELAPDSLSSLEKEYLEVVNNLFNNVIHHRPDIDHKGDLLNRCIWKGFTLQKMHQPILGSKFYFSEIFKKNKLRPPAHDE